MGRRELSHVVDVASCAQLSTAWPPALHYLSLQEKLDLGKKGGGSGSGGGGGGDDDDGCVGGQEVGACICRVLCPHYSPPPTVPALPLTRCPQGQH